MLKEYEDQNGDTKRWSVGYSCIIRVLLGDGTFHEDVGFGSVVNEKDRGKAIENARKEAVSDGVKRALRYFGAALGNCVYDKQYVNAVSAKPKAQPPLQSQPHAPQFAPQFPPQFPQPQPSARHGATISACTSSMQSQAGMRAPLADVQNAVAARSWM